MNVKYQYGDHHAGNEAGRLLYQEDATGMQQFSYGKLGEITKNVRTFVLPNYEFYTFKMEWEYDSWNRIKKITYPDEEIVTYNYDRAGMLIEVVGDKSSNGYGYLKNQGYDKFGNKNMMAYYNGIRTFYDYDPLNRRLQHLYGLDSQDDTVQNVMYYYDAANNITKVEKSAERGVGGVPYSTTITYQYDDLYRMTCSGGLMLYNNNGNYMFKMCLAYSPSGNISRKQLDSQILTVNGDENKIYDFDYAYHGTQPHALSSLKYYNGEKLYEWTPNGNMQKEGYFYSGSLVATRKMHWDEENRLTTLLDVDKTLNYYTYDAAGERTLKLTGNFEEMNINGQYNINAYNLNTYTLYTSPYMVIDPKAKGYTKHYYIESDRFVSKIGGGMANINYNIRHDHVYGMDINDPSDYNHKSYHLFEEDGMMPRHFDIIDVHAEVIKDYDFRQISKFQEYDEEEKEFFFYHKDHLGSSTQISDRDANIIHHVEYMPSGEQFSEQRDSWATPYKFNSKELDAETGLYYYGARYYTPEIGIWLSVDPMSDKYPHQSNYMYCSGRLVNVIDPDGRDEWDVCTQTGKMTWIKDSDKDVLFLTLKDKRTGAKSKEFDKHSFYTKEIGENDKNGVPKQTDIFFKNNETGQDVYNFLADNTDVEFSRVLSEDKSTTLSQNTTVHTSHEKDSESGGASRVNVKSFIEDNNLIEFEHSHSYNKFKPKDCPQCSSDKDRSHKDRTKVNHPDAKFYIRHSGGLRREYTNDTKRNNGR